MPIAIPGLAAVAAALVALLIIFALVSFMQAMAHIVPVDWPIIGHTLRNMFLAVAAVGSAAAQWLMCDIIRPIINIVMNPIVNFIKMLDSLEHFARSMAGSWGWLLDVQLPRLLAVAEGYAAHLVGAARTYALALVHNLAAAIVRDITAVRAYAAGLVHHWVLELEHAIGLARAYALALVHHYVLALEHDIAAVESHVIAYARAGDQALGRTIHAVEGEVATITATTVKLISSGVANAIKVSEAYTAAEVSRAIHLVDVDAVAKAATVFDGAIVDVGHLIDTIGTDLPDIGASLRSIATDVPGDLAAALTMTGALSIPMLRFMRECGVPNCRNLSQFGRELRDLLGALEDGALIAFLAMLCTDPQAATRFVVDDIGGIIDGAVGAARDLMGVA